MTARGLHPNALAAVGSCLEDLRVPCGECRRQWLSLNHAKHVLCVGVYALLLHGVLLLFGVYASRSRMTDHLAGDSGNDPSLSRQGADGLDPVKEYGLLATLALYGLRLTAFSPCVFIFVNVLGLVLFSVFPAKPRLRRSPLLTPFLCFRVVTRGTFPQLVKENIEKNLEVLKNINLQNFEIEVVTDHSIGLPTTSRIHELVVPKEYTTAHGALYKARALQYSLEPEVNTLSDEDWIVHLDEETLLTEEAVVGVINFVADGRHQFGQGVITYSKGSIVNWFTTLADSIRVGIDYGSLRFCLKVLHRPVFGWKGSFIVAHARSEREVSFDHGPAASIAEDCFFAMVAMQRGHSFGFVEGEMQEKSAFTLRDFVQQRRRWMEGIALTARSDKILLRYRFGPILVTLAAFCMPFAVLNIPLGFLTPIPMPWYLDLLCAVISSTFAFLYLIGSLTSFSHKRFGYSRYILIAVLGVLNSFLILGFEIAASILAFWTPSTNEFYIVQKELISTASATSPPAKLLSTDVTSAVNRIDGHTRVNGYIKDHDSRNSSWELNKPETMNKGFSAPDGHIV